MMKLGGVIYLCMLFVESLTQQVNTPDGPIQGIIEETNTGKPLYAYYSIPYAKPPTGSRRFLAPEPIDPWTEVYDASTEKPNICYQLYDDNENESEDCLYLNIFSPQDPSSAGNSSLPVMVNIHGGGFVSGTGISSNGISPKYLVDEDVIFISLNYRLGVFGFLSTGDKVIPGNAGLRDQIQALTWIQRNIAAFGGDPKKVTILGQSAGGASVGYLVLSPAASGLFAGGIMESGTALCPWAYQRNETQISYKTASFVDSQIDSSTSSEKLLEILQNADAEAIDSAASQYAAWDSQQPAEVQRLQLQHGYYFAPVVDAASDNPVLPDFQYECLASGNVNKVPILMGICSEEGLANFDQNLDYILQNYDDNPAFLNPQDLHIDGEDNWNEVGNLIKQEYSPSDTFVNSKLGGIQYFTEHDFVRAAVKYAELQSSQSDVYFYEFSYSGTLGWNTDRRYPGSGNVTHVEEQNYIFFGGALDGFPQEDRLIHNRMIRMWTNFAKFQNPTPSQDELLQNISWPKVRPELFQYVNIGNFSETDLTVVQNKPKADRIAFWEDIYKKYGKRPFDTY